jgi:hypothetical protein
MTGATAQTAAMSQVSPPLSAAPLLPHHAVCAARMAAFNTKCTSCTVLHGLVADRATWLCVDSSLRTHQLTLLQTAPALAMCCPRHVSLR